VSGSGALPVETGSAVPQAAVYAGLSMSGCDPAEGQAGCRRAAAHGLVSDDQLAIGVIDIARVPQRVGLMPNRSAGSPAVNMKTNSGTFSGNTPT
jgi:hypothetical protein